MLNATMGQHDGRFSDNVYLTSDLSFAAYLLLWGFTLLGAIDTEIERKEFGLLPPADTANTEMLISNLTADFEEKHYRDYYMKIRDLRHALSDPIRREP